MMPFVVRTMGVDQVAGGLEVSVAEWSDVGAREPLFDGVLRGAPERLIRDTLMLVQAWKVRRALVDPLPESFYAQNFLAMQPEVFAIHRGSQHNAASLAEVAYRRLSTTTLESIPENETRLVSVERDPVDQTRHAFRVYVPPGQPVPTHVVIPLDGADAMERLDGSRVVEKVMPTHEARIVSAVPVEPRVAFPRQVWALAPTTTLPTQGWSLALSVYGDGKIVHEQVVTEHQMMGLANLADELAREAAEWVERFAPAADLWTAELTVFAGETQIEKVAWSSSQPMLLAGTLHEKAVILADWVRDNAVAMEQQYPSVNLPAEGPYDLPDIEADTYDYER